MAKKDATLRTTFKVNLSELFGKKFPSNASLKKRIGEEIIARIQARTQRSINKKGKRFTPYTEEYADKKGTTQVDLVLSEKMQGNMKVLPSKQPSIVKVGFGKASERLKAENHIHGVTLPKRDFMGLPAKELNSIKSEFEDDV